MRIFFSIFAMQTNYLLSKQFCASWAFNGYKLMFVLLVTVHVSTYFAILFYEKNICIQSIVDAYLCNGKAQWLLLQFKL